MFAGVGKALVSNDEPGGLSVVCRMQATLCCTVSSFGWRSGLHPMVELVKIKKLEQLSRNYICFQRLHYFSVFTWQWDKNKVQWYQHPWTSKRESKTIFHSFLKELFSKWNIYGEFCWNYFDLYCTQAEAFSHAVISILYGKMQSSIWKLKIHSI